MRHIRLLADLFKVNQAILIQVVLIADIAGILIGFWFWFEYKGLVAVLSLYACVAVYAAYRYSKKADPYYVLDGEAAMAEATKLLEAAKENMYYYGGADFIGEHSKWRKAYEKKLNDEKFKLYRFLDAKPAIILKEMIEGIKQQDLAKKDSEKYAAWLKLHASYLEVTEEVEDKYNHFYDFEGAPIWKYGFHFMIFDDKDVVIVFLSTATTRTAVFIPDNAKMAKPLLDHLNYLKDNFFRSSQPGRKRASSDDLLQLAELPENSQVQQESC